LLGEYFQNYIAKKDLNTTSLVVCGFAKDLVFLPDVALNIAMFVYANIKVYQLEAVC